MIYSIVRKLGGFALVSVAALTLHDLSLRQTPEANPIPIPPECGDTFQCSTDWLSQALGFSLDSHSQKSLGGGFTTNSVRLNLNPSDPNSNPRSVVVKYYSEADANTWKKRFMMWCIGGIEKIAKKEIVFYRHLRPGLEEIGVKSPKPFYLAIQDYGPRSPLLYISGLRTWFRSVLIFDDLGEHKSYKVGDHLPEDCAEVAAKNLGKLHAGFFDNTQPLQLLNPDIDWRPTAYEGLFGLFSYPKSKETVIERLNNWQEQFPILQNPELRSSFISLTDLYPKITYLQNEKSLSSHTTLLHGDFHPGNMFFVNDPETKKVTDSILIDWQAYGIGHPSTEFAYFLQSVKPDPDERLMKIYYDELTTKVSPDSYPFEVFTREVELRTVRLMGFRMNYIKQTPEKAIEQAKKMGTEFQGAFFNSNLIRFNYIFQKWQKENFIQDLENLKTQDEKTFLGFKILRFSIASLLFS